MLPLPSPSGSVIHVVAPPPCHPPLAALVGELRQLPSKAALQLRSDAANVAATAGIQSKAVERSLRRVAREYGI